MKNLLQQRNGLTVGRVSKLLATINRAKTVIVLLTTLLVAALGTTAWAARTPTIITCGTQSVTATTYGTNANPTFSLSIANSGGSVTACTLSYTGLPNGASALPTSFPLNANPTSGTITVTTLATNAAGTYTVTVRNSINTITGSFSLTIAKAPTTTVVTVGGPFTYTGLAQTPATVSVTGAGLSLTLAASYANNINAGTATASYNYAETTNYLSSSDSKDFTIDKAPLTITGVIASSKTYNGLLLATLTGTAKYEGLQNGQSFPVIGTPSANFLSAAVGTGKTVTVAGYTAPSANYTVTQPSLTANITTAPLTITANNQAKCSGDLDTFPFSGSEFTPTGLVNGETVGSVALASDGSSPGVAAGSYSIVPSSATGGTVSNYNITYVNGTLTVGNKWLGYSEEWDNANNWCEGSVPINTTDVIIPSGSVNYPTISEAAVCNNITIQSGATLVDNSLLTISGTAYVQQYLASDRNWYVSSPVETAPATDLTTATSVVCYNEATAGWVPPKDGTLTPLQGYISVATKTDGAITFSGKLNTGTKSTSLLCTSGTKAGFNLVGNPYPSYVNIEDAPKTNLLDTYWYRSQNGSKTYVFDTYGLTSHYGTNNSGLGAATKYIPPMQAFWVRVATIAGGTIGFTNLNRGHKAGTNNPLRAPSASKVTQQVLRLQVSNGVNSDETIIAFNPNASNSYDAYDSQKQSNGSAAVPEIYTMAGTEQVAINGLNTLIPDEELPLGFTTGQSNAFSIMATEMSGFDSGLKIILKDNLLNTEQDLTANNTYTFSSNVVNTTDRFTLIFRAPGSVTALNTVTNDQNVLVYKNADNQIMVKCAGDVNNENSVVVYNGVGQKLLAKQLTSNVTVLDAPLTSGVYMVTVTNAGKSVTKKVILN